MKAALYKKKIKSSLNSLLGEELGKEVFDKNFNYKSPKGYTIGEVMTLKELKALPDKTVIHLKYLDEDDHVRENGFQVLEKSDDPNDLEWTTEEGFTIPLNKIKPGKIENIDNSGWTFTIKHALKKK